MTFRVNTWIRAVLCTLSVVALVLSTLIALPVDTPAAAPGDAARSRTIRYARSSDGRRAPVIAYGHLGRIDAITEVSREAQGKRSFDVEPSDALAFLASNPELIGSSDLADSLTLQRSVSTRLGTHVTFEQRIGSRLVFGARTTLHVDRSGDVFGLATTLAPSLDTALASVEPTIDPQTAQVVALASAGVTAERVRIDEPVAPELGIADVDGGRLAWRIVVSSHSPYGEWAVLVDALTGQALGEPEPLFATAGQARIFVPNAVVSTNNVGLTDNGNSGTAVPESGYSLVELQGLDSSGFLTGPYVSTDRTDNRVNSPSGDFTNLRRDDAGFAEAEVYWAIDYAQRYIQNTLDIDNAANYVIRADVHAFSDDNSNYTRSGANTGVLNFGDGGVDDAQDAEIVWHEYGHALLDNTGQITFGGESGAIHEGFGDYVAATLSTTVPGNSRFYTSIGEWDAVSYNPGNPPFLRRVDTDKQYPEDLVRQVHTDGEIYSSCLWDLHQAVGRDIANRIIFNANFLLPSSPTIPDAAEAILQADAILNGGANGPAIAAAFGGHGIELDGVPPSVTFVKRKKGKLTVDGGNFTTGTAVIEINGAAMGSMKYPKPFRNDGVSTRVTSKDNRVAALTPGVSVTITVLNPGTGLRSAPFAFVP